MRKPNMIFLSIIALVALLPHTSRWLTSPEQASTPSVSAAPTAPPIAPTERRAAPVLTASEDHPAAVPETLPAPSQNQAPVEEAHPWDVLPIAEPVDTEPLNTLEEIYLTESFDADWAGPLEADFYQTFEMANLSDSAVEAAECRATLCRFALLHDDPQAQNAFIQAFLESPLLPLIHQGAIAHHSQQAADGSITAIYFLARNELAHARH